MTGGRVGGNRKPQTFKTCEHCGERFGPVERLRRRYCSPACKANAQRVIAPRVRQPATREARRAQRRVALAIADGRLVRPSACEECGSDGAIEAAHFDYARPEEVRWLCISCHRRWDAAAPKGGVHGNLETTTEAPAPA